MADEEVKKEEKSEKKGFNFKVVIIGLPLFIIQLVLVYFITATFLVKNQSSGHTSEDGSHIEEVESDDESEEGEEGAATQIFSINDLIINPAGTSGQKLLLLSVGFGVNNEEKLNMLKENEVIITDMLLNTISQKSLRTLSKIELKDSLKVELKHKINDVLPKAKVKNIYFSKYVLN